MMPALPQDERCKDCGHWPCRCGEWLAVLVVCAGLFVVAGLLIWWLL